MSVKLELYRVFKEVAEVGNIPDAAQALYISQSAVSQSIKQLENDLQTRLFSRNSRGVTLTAEGKMLYEYVRSAMGLLETGEEKLSQRRELQMGHLTIGASDTVTGQFLTPYLDAFHHQHPGIRLKIVSGRSAKVLSMLRSGAVDIAFASSPKDSTLDAWPCFATHSVFVAGKNYDCNFDKIYTRQEIAEFPLILLERKASSRVFLEHEFLKAGVTLTPEGEMLYSRIASAAVQIQDAEEELSASATLEHGSISISATETALNIYLAEKLRTFHTEYPGIRLRISNHSTPQAVQAVKNGEVDFAIISTPAEVEQGLKMVELRPFYEVLVGGKTFTALASQRLTLKELSCYPLISLSDESMTRSFYRQFFLDHDAVLRPDTEAATTDQMLTLVKSELGLAFVPEPMTKELLARGELVELHLQEIIPSRSICLVYDHHRPLNTAARKFQQMLTKAEPGHPAAPKQAEGVSFESQ